MRAPKRNLCLSAFSMHRDCDLTLAPLFMLVSVKAAAVLGQPFPKCGTFHCFVPIYQVLNCVEPVAIERNLSPLRIINKSCFKRCSSTKARASILEGR
jgi:hypothetical protein